jgi:hypothetical protein
MDRSLLINIYSAQKGGLMRNLDNIKASTKMTVSVTQDYHSFIVQVEACAFSRKYIFGIDSLLTRQIFISVDKVKHHSIAYNNWFASDGNFAAKILWVIDKSVNLFPKERRRCDKHKNSSNATSISTTST